MCLSVSQCVLCLNVDFSVYLSGVRACSTSRSNLKVCSTPPPPPPFNYPARARRKRLRRAEKHGTTAALSGVATGGKELMRGLFSGLAGIVVDPYKGARDGGVGGFFKGEAFSYQLVLAFLPPFFSRFK